MTNLYYICNGGCDDETCGLARISDEDFPKFKEIIENLNKNSTYGCMPTIVVYRIDEGLIREATDDDQDSALLYFEGKKYALKNSLRTYTYGEGYKYIEGVEEVI